MDASTNVGEIKRELRDEFRRARRARVAVEGDAARIAEHVLDVEEVRDACAGGRPIGCYVSRTEEPPTEVLRERLLDSGAQVLLPRIDGEDLVWVRVTPETTWDVNRWNIEEPVGPTFDGSPAVWIIPGLAIDADGYRLGQGGGYFDRALADIGDDALVIAIVFESEFVSELPRELHDRRVDVVVTPDRVRWLSMPD